MFLSPPFHSPLFPSAICDGLVAVVIIAKLQRRKRGCFLPRRAVLGYVKTAPECAT